MFLFIGAFLFGALMELFGKGHELSMMMSPIYAGQYNRRVQTPVNNDTDVIDSLINSNTSSREKRLEYQSTEAQIEVERLRRKLANQAQLTQQLQIEANQKQMSDKALAQKQRELAVALQEKEELEAKLAESENKSPIIQNITYNIQDSAISGDITNKIN